MTLLPRWLAKVVCRFLKHEGSESTYVDPVRKLSTTVLVCRRCGELWPMCEWCGLRPGTMECWSSEGEKIAANVCRPCVGV